MKKAFIISILILALIGGVLAYLLSPRKVELAYMNYKDKNYAQALVLYKQLWNDNERGLNVAIPLSRLYLLYGKVGKAVDVMEYYVKRHPNKYIAREKLATYYLYNQQTQSYLKNLEKMYKMKPSAKLLRQLSFLYSSYQQYNKQIEILETLIRQYAANDDDYLNLAYLYADHGQLDKAQKLLFDYIHKQHKLVKVDLLEFSLDTLLQSGKVELAQQLLKTQLGDNPERILTIVNRLDKTGHVKLAATLLEQFKSKFAANESLYAKYVAMKYELDDYQAIYKDLLKQFDQNKLPDALLDTFISMLISQSNAMVLQQVVSSDDMSLISNDVLLEMAVFMLDEKQAQMAKKLYQLLGKGFLNHYPILKVVLMAAAGEPGVVKEAMGITVSKFPLPKVSILAYALAKINKKESAKAILRTIERSKNFVSVDFFQLTNIYLALDDVDAGLKFLKSIQQQKDFAKHARLQQSILILYAASGQGKEIEQWFASNRPDSVQLMVDIYHAANRYKHYSIALTMAKRIHQFYPSDKSLLYLGRTYVHLKQYKQALNYFDQLVNSEYDISSGYITSMVAVIHQSSPAVAAKLKAKLVAYINKKLSDKSLSNSKLRNYGYILLEQGFKQEALIVFKKLADQNDAKREDVDSLIYIVGPRPSQKIARWIVQKSDAASSVDIDYWLEKLIYIGDNEKVVQLVQSGKVNIHQLSTMKLYFSALINMDNKLKLADAMTRASRQIRSKRDIKRLDYLIKIAVQEDLSKLAANLYRHKLQYEPYNKKALAYMVEVELYLAHYDATWHYINLYTTRYPITARMNYIKGKLYWREYKYNLAKAAYRLSLAALNKKQSSKIIDQVMRANILYFLGQHRKSFALYRAMIKRYPHNLSIKTEYTYLLINAGLYSEAKAVAAM